MNQDNQSQGAKQELKVPVMGYLALIFAIIFFSGIFANAKGWQSALDFNTINGKFGTIVFVDGAKKAGISGSTASCPTY